MQWLKACAPFSSPQFKLERKKYTAAVHAEQERLINVTAAGAAGPPFDPSPDPP